MSADSGMATEYMSNVQQTLYVFVMGTVYSDDICLRYNYGIYFSSKKNCSYIPRLYLKYNVRKGMVGRSEDVP